MYCMAILQPIVNSAVKLCFSRGFTKVISLHFLMANTLILLYLVQRLTTVSLDLHMTVRQGLKPTVSHLFLNQFTMHHSSEALHKTETKLHTYVLR